MPAPWWTWWLVRSSAPPRRLCLGLGLPFCHVSGQRKEDVVERRPAEGDVVDRDRRIVEPTNDLHERLRAPVRWHGQPAGVLVERHIVTAVLQQLGRLRDLRLVADDDLN